jgi:hypothetical protein
MLDAKPYGGLRHRDIKGKRMAFIDEGDGDGDRVRPRHPHVVVCVAQRDAAPGRSGPADRARLDPDDVGLAIAELVRRLRRPA